MKVILVLGQDGVWYFVAPGSLVPKDGCKVLLTSNFSIPNNAITPVTWTAGNSEEKFDTNGYHNPDSNPGRLTVPPGSEGTFLVLARLEYEPNATDVRVAYLRHKDSGGVQVEVSTEVRPNNTASYSVAVSVMDVFDMEAGDYVQVDGLQVSGVALNLFAGSTHLTMIRLGSSL